MLWSKHGKKKVFSVERVPGVRVPAGCSAAAPEMALHLILQAWTLQMVYVNQHVCDAYQSHCASHRHAGLEALMHMTLVLLSLLQKTCPKSKPRLTNGIMPPELTATTESVGLLVGATSEFWL